MLREPFLIGSRPGSPTASGYRLMSRAELRRAEPAGLAIVITPSKRVHQCGSAGRKETTMRKLLHARPPEHDEQEREVWKLGASRHAPWDRIRRARMLTRN